MTGFFTATQSLSVPPPSLIPRCGICRLWEACEKRSEKSKLKVYGEGRKGVLIVGESPGFLEAKTGKPFVGDAGQYLRKQWEKLDFDMDKDAWTYNAVICHPVNEKGTANRQPTDKEVLYCRPNVIRTINELKPNVVILLGGVAIKSVIGWIWNEDVGSVSRWVGWRIPDQKTNSWICPTWHPSYLMRMENDKKKQDVYRVAERLFLEHLRKAINKKSKPWKEIPNYKKQVATILNPVTAAFDIRQMIKYGKPVAWDIETESLKPDSKDVDIVCCSMSNGEFTFAYPWCKEAIEATKEFLVSDIPKWGFNTKFEHRWCRAKLGINVRNWKWCGMLAAHCLDNRSDICSLAFQEYVLLGFSGHKAWIKPYMQASGTNTKNRLSEVDLKQLLLYNGLDSLVEWHVAKRQRKLMGYNDQSRFVGSANRTDREDHAGHQKLQFSRTQRS